jgi:hypothetical protein
VCFLQRTSKSGAQPISTKYTLSIYESTTYILMYMSNRLGSSQNPPCHPAPSAQRIFNSTLSAAVFLSSFSDEDTMVGEHQLASEASE